MSFSIQIKTVDNFELIQISDSQTGIVATILTRGALLNSWSIVDQGSTTEFVEGNDLSNGWKDFEQNGFRSAKMNPFACRLYKGSYAHLDKKYTIEKYYTNGHAIHGIIYDAIFSIKSSGVSDENAYVILEYQYLGQDKGFPFSYTIEVKWVVEANRKILVATSITNQSDGSIPMVDGWHPYFTLGNTIEDCTITFKAKGKMQYDQDLLPTGAIIEEKSFEQGKKIGSTLLDDGFELDQTNLTCSLENDLYSIKIQPNSNYPYLQLYTPPNRKSIAIENLSAAPNAFNNKMGLQLLEPHENILFKTSYQLFIK